jgi:thiol-disulfide isomerase/thioredoxin
MQKYYSGLLVFVTCYLLTLQTAAQAPVIIKGKFETTVESTPVSVFKPYAGYFNTFFPDTKSEALIENNAFQLKVSITKAGFIRILSKGMPKTYFFAAPGDTIQASFYSDSAGIMKIKYAGPNAAANNWLVNNKMNNARFAEPRIESILQSGEPAATIFEQLKAEASIHTKPLAQLLQQKKISAACYHTMKSEIEQKMLFWASSYLKRYFEGNSDTTAVNAQRTAVMQLVTQKLFGHFDPYVGGNLAATTNFSNSHSKSILQRKGIIPAKQPAMAYWAKWDKQFTTVVSQVSAFDYAPDQVQQYVMGAAFLNAAVFKSMGNDDFVQVFNAYQNKFPNSPYIPVITTWLVQNRKSAGDFKLAMYRLDDQNKQLIEEEIKGNDSITTLQALVQKNFTGSPVFVDVWATWCSPCIAEFNNEPKLRKFLADNNIKILYISIDNIESAANWQKMVANFRLTGYHYLANQEVYNNINKLFIGIPRYLLFNAKGELVQDNLPRPHTGDALFKQISQSLK